MIGTTISHFRVLEKLGEGGMGLVYKAHDTKLDRIVALKFLHSGQLGSDEDREGLLREARSAAAISHPNVCSIISIEETDSDEFLVMEFLEGKSLRTTIDTGPMEIQAALGIAIGLASGLQAAHRKEIVHRDIKPENVIITTEGVAKITDFGLARQKECLKGSGDGVMEGTEAYMSPEQLHGEPVDHRTDIWSFGVVLYEMLTGQRPFQGAYSEAIKYSIANQKHPPASSVRQEIPGFLESVIDQCLEKSSTERFPDADSLIEKLRQADNTLPRPGEGGAKSIAVLPFSDLSPDQDNQYFGEGLTEEIITRLSKLSNLSVVSRLSVMQSHLTGKGTKQIAADLDVQFILKGSVRKQGSNLRITTQLVDAARERYLWSENYSGTMDDIFEIQETVAAEIARLLKLRLTPGEEETLKRRSTENTEAYQLYLRGRFFWNKRDKEGLETAIRYFEEAIALDPEYALAWAGISDAYNLLSEYAGVPRKETYPLARKAVDKALSIDPNLAEARTSLASYLMLSEWDWVTAEQEFKKAIYLNPNYATAHHWYAEWLTFLGRLEEGLKEITRATELDPLSVPILKDRGLILYYDRQYDAAIEDARKALELDPRFASAYRLLSLAFHGKGEIDRALAENERWGRETGNRTEEAVWLAYLQAESGRTDEARLAIQELSQNVANGNLFRGLALAYLSLGDKDAALEWLERGYESRAESMSSLKVDPKMDALASEARFVNLLERMNLLQKTA